MLIQRAEDFFVTDEPSTAIAYLCRVLRDNPSNQIVAERLASALVRRNFILPVSEPMRHEWHVQAAYFSPDGRLVVTCGKGDAAQIWEALTGQARGAPLKHENRVLSARFSPDRKWVVTASRDNTAQIWDARTG